MEQLWEKINKIFFAKSFYLDEIVRIDFYRFTIVVHIVYALFYFFMGIVSLAFIVLGSAGIFMICVQFVRKDRKNAALVFAIFEVNLVCFATDRYFGWNFAAHAYVLSIIPLTAAKGILSNKGKVILYSFNGFIFLTMQHWIQSTVPIIHLPSWIFEIMSQFNSFGAFAIVGFILYQYSKAVSEQEKRFQEANERLTWLANTDQLTGIFNRRYMYNELESEKNKYQQNLVPFVIAIADIDNFKQINDQFGHLYGDQVLKDTVHVIQSMLREGDIVARWGGEEFLVLLPNTDLSSAMHVMERVRKTLANQNYFETENSPKVTVTIGLAVYVPDSSINEIIHLADQRLYLGKQLGKNRITVC